ncbi:MAG: tRNA (adenosine(37)-N6)-threonylcarbamoyltransferase complex ATPase subunit type 1 TsaE [Candidatus Magasanikbacteria bacterium CG11_big_fil_rev_8_21_14_0_20_39_34]|uniref:tRNA threonylcarbamoyladenosine biosynthesis protein TsaE n=1 Tax=Candidatus Magasanikbacteria bacterium CG11_big_fil_rev_8_21_14_0_20_39_34 TaxID=1974653 RepID=A0A2H0N4X6_9BACT|nr:MAG: tRNA (adenosine(37)-N6)-threonylcarbamoyltransferase complex ATPase subunit type 1 TsaE [Candidatus Magasanikbacteria bacterium CG11_big_fil_rev_8_21_14_0_20_39_34]
MDYITNSSEETSALASSLVQKISPGTVLLLKGDLGSGKTTFTKAFAKTLGVQEEITSPTFTLMNLYDTTQQDDLIHKIIHIDTYRMESEDELISIGAQDYIGMQGSVTLIEWPEKLSTLLEHKHCITLEFEHLSENTRKISVQFPLTSHPEPV